MEQSKPDGGAAFPHPSQDFREYVSREPEPGMSLRDWFAGQVLNGEAANGGWDGTKEMEKRIAEWCYKQADAMIAARARSTNASD